MRRRGKVIRFPGAPEPPRLPTAWAEPTDERGLVEDERGLVEIHRCDQAEGMVIKSLFHSEGIPTLLRSRFTHSLHPFTVGAQGEVIILVPESEARRSRVLLTRLIAG